LTELNRFCEAMLLISEEIEEIELIEAQTVKSKKVEGAKQSS